MSAPHILITGKAGHGKDTIGEYLVARHGFVRTAFADPVKSEVCDAYRHSPFQVDHAFLNDRRTKANPCDALSLRFCSDAAFVELALEAFRDEDDELFARIKRSSDAHAFARDLDTTEFGKSLLLNALTHQDLGLEDRLNMPRSPRRTMQTWGTDFRRRDNDAYWVDIAYEYLLASGRPVVICDGRFENEMQWARDRGLQRIHVERPLDSGAQLTTPASQHASEQIPPPDERTIVIINDKQDDGLRDLYSKVEEAMETLLQQRRPTHKLAACAGF